MFGLDTFGTSLFFLGALGTTIYVLKMLLALCFGIGDDDLMDMDVDGIDFTVDTDVGDVSGDVDVDIDTNHSSGFNWLSINVVTSFLMLFGWFGLAAYHFLLQPEMFTYENGWIALLIAQTASVVLGCFAGYGGVRLNFWFIKKFASIQQSGSMKMKSLLGQQGTVYIRISPGKTGAIMIKSDNSVVMEISATSHRKEVIQSGTKVRVIELEKGKVVVEPVNEGD